MTQRWAYIGMTEVEARDADLQIRMGQKPEHHGRPMLGQIVTGFHCTGCDTRIVRVSDREARRLGGQGAVDIRPR